LNELFPLLYGAHGVPGFGRTIAALSGLQVTALIRRLFEVDHDEMRRNWIVKPHLMSFGLVLNRISGWLLIVSS
jgi:hypothetical protein